MKADGRYIIRRLLQLIVILFVITFLSYGMMCLAGSDAVLQKMTNTESAASEEVIEAARAELGLDKPFLTQYFVWLNNLLHGDMGTSYISGEDVFAKFISKLPATLLLTLVSVLFTIVISIPLGIVSAVYQNRFIDLLIRFCSFVGNSMPNFFAALLLVLIITAAGTVLGVLAGYLGGVVDTLIMRISDVCLAFPEPLLCWSVMTSG